MERNNIGTHLRFTRSELDNIEAVPLLLTTALTSWLDKILEEWFQWAPEDTRGSTSYATLKCALTKSGFDANADSFSVSTSPSMHRRPQNILFIALLSQCDIFFCHYRLSATSICLLLLGNL